MLTVTSEISFRLEHFANLNSATLPMFYRKPLASHPSTTYNATYNTTDDLPLCCAIPHEKITTNFLTLKA